MDPHAFIVFFDTWWRHQMKTFSALLALCTGNSPVTSEFPTQRPDVLCDVRLNKRLNKQSRPQWFETPSRSSLRHCHIIKPYREKLGITLTGYDNVNFTAHLIVLESCSECISNIVDTHCLWNFSFYILYQYHIIRVPLLVIIHMHMAFFTMYMIAHTLAIICVKNMIWYGTVNVFG